MKKIQPFPMMTPLAAALLALYSGALYAGTDADADAGSARTAPVNEGSVPLMNTVTVTGLHPSSLPVQIPATMTTVTATDLADTINATDSEDALKYQPSLLVRKRYVGDYNHAVLSSRASGTGNSARSAVYADGILLSNYLGNGASYAPRWGMVTPEEIERVDVMYGPFSAAYPGNSAGAIVDYVTRMPRRFEAHAQVKVFDQGFDLYSTHQHDRGKQLSASLGNRIGDWSWWIDVNHLNSHGQPLVFANRSIASGVTGTAGTPVSGAISGLDRSNNPWYILGTTTEYTTVQDHAKIKLAYDLAPTMRASYTLGIWQNDANSQVQTYLRDANGAPVYSGKVNINGASYTLTPSDFSPVQDHLVHVMQGLSLKTHGRPDWNWEVSASQYTYRDDQSRTATGAMPFAQQGGTGTLLDQSGTGWNNLSVRASWRPEGAHLVELGYQLQNFTLAMLKTNLGGNWLTDSGGSLNSDVGGKTRLQGWYLQDTWNWTPRLKSVLGLRAEQWDAWNGHTATFSTSVQYGDRRERSLSPKAALLYQWDADTAVKAAIGRAVRMPTVSELYGATSGNITVINDPTLRPEKSWTSELSLEHRWDKLTGRATLFFETVSDSLYSQSTGSGSAIVTRIMNVGRIRTPGVELALEASDVWTRGLDINANMTWADSRIVDNAGFVTSPGDTLDKYQPRVPVWRASTVLSYRASDQWQLTLAARYSGRQYSTLNNSDPNGFAYMGASSYFTVDVRARYRIAEHWTASMGIDNLNNAQYWNFHPYPQRTVIAELRYDL